MQQLTSRKTRNAVIGSIGALVLFASAAQPAFAAENILQQLQQTITGRLERLYLQLIPGEKPGKLVLKQMGEATQSLKSFQGRTTLELTALSAQQSVGEATLELAGPTVVGQVWNPTSYLQDLAVKGSLNYQGKSLQASANLRMIDGVTYLQLRELPEMNGADLSNLLNTWVKFEPLPASGSAQESVPQWSAEEQEKVQTAFYRMLDNSEVSTARVEKKEGGDVYVFTATLSKPALAEYLITLRQAEAEVGSSGPDMLDPADLQTQTDQMLSNIGEITATFWVDKSRFYPRHFELPLEINVLQARENEGEGSAGLTQTLPVNDVDTLMIFVTSDMTNYNENYLITTPENAEDSRVFFTKIMGAFMPGLSGMMPPLESQTPSNSMMQLISPKPDVSQNRLPTVGTTELPSMSPEQKKALEQYEQMLKQYPELSQ
ncbi:hypothetical protein H3C70_03465 [Patescibacteria group bacterium]|nr:hypothetical protein [Patescibacteria group bacterium]